MDPSIETKTKIISRFPPFLRVMGIIVAIIVTTSLFVLLKNKIIKTPEVKSSQAVNYFTVVSTTPENNSSNNDQDVSVKIVFSEAIDPNNLKNYFTVSPMIPGTFSQGQTDKEVIFKAKYPFGEGASVNVILNKGFQSVSGDKFTSDYSFNFYTHLKDSTVQFEKDGIYSRLLNLPINKEVIFNLYVGQDVPEDGNITVYKASFDQFVSSMLYKNETHEDTKYVTQTFIDYPVDTSKMQKISSSKGLTANTKVNFQEGPGLYYVDAEKGKDKYGFTWVNVTNEGFIIKEDDQKIIIATQNIETGDTNISAHVLLYNLNEKPTLLSVTQLQSYGEIPLQYPQIADLVVGQTQNGIILAPINIPQTQADIRVNKNLSDTDKIFISTDKPAYETNEKVRFNGVVREDNDANYLLPTNTNVQVWLVDTANPSSKIIDQTVHVNEKGIFSGELTLPTDIPKNNQSYVSLTLFAKEIKNSALYITSPSYTTFDIVSENNSGKIAVTFEKNAYTKNEKIIAHIKAFTANNNPLASQNVSYTVYAKNYYENDPISVAEFGNEWGEKILDNQNITLDKDGKIDVELDEKDNNISKAITVEATAFIDNKDIHGAKTVLVKQGDVFLTFASSRQNYQTSDTIISRVLATDTSGNPKANLNVTYQIYKSDYDNITKSFKETILKEGNVVTDTNGNATITESITSDPGSLAVRITAKDSEDNIVQNERTINIVNSPTNYYGLYYHELELTNLDIQTDKISYVVGDQAHLVINSPSDKNVLISFERGRLYHNEWLLLHKGANTYNINITQDLAPSFNIAFSYFSEGQFFVEGLSLNVTNPTKKIQITVVKDAGQILITTKDNSGQPISANLLVNILDNNIFALRDNMPSGDIAWLFNSPRGDTTNFSASTLGIGTGSGCGGGSGIDINYIPNRLGEDFYLNADLQTDQNGEIKIDIPDTTSQIRIITNVVTTDTASAQNQTIF